MAQAALIVAVFAIGTAVSLAIGPRRAAIAAAFGLPVGLILYVVCAIVLMVAGAPYTPATMAGCGLAVLAAAAVAIWRRGGIDRAMARALAGWTLALAAVAAVFSAVDLAVLSSDSHTIVLYGQVVALEGSLDPVIDKIFAWGVFQVVAQSASMFVGGGEWMFGLHTTAGVWFAPLFWLLLGDGIEVVTGERPRRRTLALVTVALFSIYLFHHHVLYLHSNFGSAIALFGFAIGVWLAEVRRDASLLPLAFVCLLGFSLMRIEAPAVAAVFALILLVPSELPRRTIAVWFGLYVIAIAAWYVVLARSAPAEGQFLTSGRCYLIVAGLAATYAAWAASALPGVRRLRPHAPEIVTALAVLALAASFAVAPGHMAVSARWLLANLAILPWWGYVWWLIAVLAIASLFIADPPHGKLFTWGTVIFFTCVVVLASGRDPYRYGSGDSGNRMMVHILPLLFYYFGLKLAIACYGRSSNLRLD